LAAADLVSAGWALAAVPAATDTSAANVAFTVSLVSLVNEGFFCRKGAYMKGLRGYRFFIFGLIDNLQLMFD
jgi:hypothetical protein